MENLHPLLEFKMTQLIDLCSKEGLKIRVTQGYRSKAEQDALYAQGRTKPGNKVTNAKGGYSMHNWGVAFDFALDMDVDGDGKTSDDLYNTSTGLFQKIGALGQSIGLEWGGSWKSFPDLPHFQLPDWGSTTSTLRAKYGTFEKFKATWKPINDEDKYGAILTEAKFRTIKDGYLRTSPEVNKNKVAFNELSATLKKKCVNKGGYALFKADYTFTRIRSYTDDDGNKWKQLKSGYWFPAVFDGVRRAEKI